MHARCRLAWLLALVFAAGPSLALAQRTTTGTIAGKITDSTGAVVPGVTLTVTSPEALGQFTAITDLQGVFRVTNLPPATYDIRAELAGFQTVIRKEPVRLNAVTEVDITMAVGSVTEAVTVTGESPIVDPERAGLSININNQALTTLPVTTNRRFQDAWLMVPGVNVNPATQELTGSERRTSLDGADVTDPFGGDIFAVNLNYDAIQDVEVKALGAEAADGSSMVGQFMNIVTKSGGNNFHGSAALFTIPQNFNDSNVQGIPANRRDTIHRVVIGRVVGIHIRDDALTADGRLDIANIRPLARLGYTDYTSVTEVFSMKAQGTAAGQIGEAVAERRKTA